MVQEVVYYVIPPWPKLSIFPPNAVPQDWSVLLS